MCLLSEQGMGRGRFLVFDRGIQHFRRVANGRAPVPLRWVRLGCLAIGGALWPTFPRSQLHGCLRGPWFGVGSNLVERSDELVFESQRQVHLRIYSNRL